MKAVLNCWLLLSCIVLASGSSRLDGDAPLGFGDPPERRIAVASFADDDIDRLLGTLDRLLERSLTDGATRDAAAEDLWTFRERLQAGQLDEAQEARVLAHLDELARVHPGAAALIDKERGLVRTLAVGKPAPEIVGTDLHGEPLQLSDFRGRVVVLAFSGEWCAACRVEYPYQRLLLEVYRNKPLTVLSVNSDRDAHVALEGKASRGLTYRSWRDGSGPKGTDGPIATAWGIKGWPTTYLIDREGIIRFVNLRQEDLLKAVRQLVEEKS